MTTHLNSIYSLVSQILFDSNDKDSDTIDYIDRLVDKGFLNYKPSSLVSIRNMLKEMTPFYEVYYRNIHEIIAMHSQLIQMSF